MDALQDIIERVQLLPPSALRKLARVIEELPHDDDVDEPVDEAAGQLSAEDDELFRNWRPSGQTFRMNEAPPPVDFGVGRITAEEVADAIRKRSQVIVTDANVGVYFVTPVGTNFTQLARAAAARDPEWHVPVIWRTEVANALLVMRRQKHFNDQLLLSAWGQVGGYRVVEHPLAAAEVLPFAHRHNLSAYDAQYVLLAMKRRDCK